MPQRHLSFFLLLLLGCAIFAVAFHHHPDLKLYADCPICKFLDDLTAGDKAKAPLLTVPGFLKTVFSCENLNHLNSVFISQNSSRSPPFSS